MILASAFAVVLSSTPMIPPRDDEPRIWKSNAPTQVLRAIRVRRALVRNCHDEAHGNVDDVQARFVVDETGAIAADHIVASVGQPERFAECVSRAFEGAHVPMWKSATESIAGGYDVELVFAHGPAQVNMSGEVLDTSRVPRSVPYATFGSAGLGTRSSIRGRGTSLGRKR